MKTRSQKKREKKAKIAKTGRAIRLKKRLSRIHKKKCEVQQDTHMTAIMEAYILKRKEQRRLEKEKKENCDDDGNAVEKKEDKRGNKKRLTPCPSSSNSNNNSPSITTTAKFSSNPSKRSENRISRPGRGNNYTDRNRHSSPEYASQHVSDSKRVGRRSLY